MKISADDLLDIMAVASNRIHRELKMHILPVV